MGIPSLGGGSAGGVSVDVTRYARLTATRTAPTAADILANGTSGSLGAITVPAHTTAMFYWFFSPYLLTSLREDGAEGEFNALPAFTQEASQLQIDGVDNYVYGGAVTFYANAEQIWVAA